MYKAVRMYTLLPGSTDTFLQRVQESFVPLIGQQAGFLAYDARHVGTNRVRTIVKWHFRRIYWHHAKKQSQKDDKNQSGRRK